MLWNIEVVTWTRISDPKHSKATLDMTSHAHQSQSHNVISSQLFIIDCQCPNVESTIVELGWVQCQVKMLLTRPPKMTGERGHD
jgi:hypothetical protein